MYTLLVAVCLGLIPVTLSKTCTVCKTEYGTARTAAATDNTKKCTALSTYLTCLEASAEGDDGCPLPSADAGAIETDYTAASCSTSPTFTDTCNCQKTFWKTAQADEAATCTAYKNELHCLGAAKTSTGCDGSTTKSAIATTAETERAKLTTASASTCPAPTSTCQCEITAAKGDNSDSTKYCSVLKTMETCLSAIKTTAEAGCTSTTQATLLTSTTEMYKKEKCASAGAGADHVTFVVTPLLVSVLASIFL